MSSILARVGISLISTDQACANAEEEIPDWDFERVVADSQDMWRDILGRVRVDAGSVDRNTTELLYSSVWLLCIPSRPNADQYLAVQNASSTCRLLVSLEP